MANRDIPAGLKPVKNFNGSPWSGKANVYYIPASDSVAVFKGDAVKAAGGADATGMVPAVAQAAAGDDIIGVVIGFGTDPNIMIHPDTPNMTHRAADTAMYCLVVDDPTVIFEAQESGALTAADVGKFADLVVGAGNATTGLSGMEINSASVTTLKAGVHLLRLVNREDNELGTNARWEVRIVEHTMALTPAAV